MRPPCPSIARVPHGGQGRGGVVRSRSTWHEGASTPPDRQRDGAAAQAGMLGDAAVAQPRGGAAPLSEANGDAAFASELWEGGVFQADFAGQGDGSKFGHAPNAGQDATTHVDAHMQPPAKVRHTQICCACWHSLRHSLRDW